MRTMILLATMYITYKVALVDLWISQAHTTLLRLTTAGLVIAVFWCLAVAKKTGGEQ